MRTGSALTVSGGVHPRRIFLGGKKIDKKRKKKLETPRKIGDTPPDQIPPPRDQTTPPPCEQKSWHTPMKILPWPNFVAAGNETNCRKLIAFGTYFVSHSSGTPGRCPWMYDDLLCLRARTPADWGLLWSDGLLKASILSCDKDSENMFKKSNRKTRNRVDSIITDSVNFSKRATEPNPIYHRTSH